MEKSNIKDIDIQGPIELREMTDQEREYFSDLEESPDRYRWESGKLFEYDQDAGAYLFCAAGLGRTKQETIQDYENSQIMED